MTARQTDDRYELLRTHARTYTDSFRVKALTWNKSKTSFFDDSKLPQKLEAWKKFQEDWALTYRDHLKKKGWPENVIDIYETAYQCLTQYRFTLYTLKNMTLM